MYTYDATVVRWVDGDTVDLRIDLGFRMSTEQRFRLLHVNTPERGEKGYNEAREYCEQMAPVGEVVRVETHKTDKYGRWLVDLFVGASSDSLSTWLVGNKLGVNYEGGKR